MPLPKDFHAAIVSGNVSNRNNQLRYFTGAPPQPAAPALPEGSGHLLMASDTAAERLVLFDADYVKTNLSDFGFYVSCVAFDPVHQVLALGQQGDPLLKLYNTSATPWVEITGPTLPAPPWQLAFSLDGNQLYVGYEGASPNVAQYGRIYLGPYFSAYFDLPGAIGGTVIPYSGQASFNGLGTRLARVNGYFLPGITVFDIHLGYVSDSSFPSDLDMNSVYAVAFNPVRRLLTVATKQVTDSGYRLQIRFYEEDTWQLLGILYDGDPSPFVTSMSWNPTGTHLMYTTDSNGLFCYEITNYDTAQGTLLTFDPALTEANSWAKAAWNGISSRLAVIEWLSPWLHVYDLTTPPLPRVPEFYTADLSAGYPTQVIYLQGASAPGVPPDSGEGEDDEEEVTFSKYVLDLPFSEASLAATVDHSETGTALQVMHAPDFYSFTTTGISAGKFSGVVSSTYNMDSVSLANYYLKALSLPIAPGSVEIEFTLGGAYVDSSYFCVIMSYNDGANSLSIVARRQLDGGGVPADHPSLLFKVPGATGTIELYETTAYAGTYKLVKSPTEYTLYKNGSLVATQAATNNIFATVGDLSIGASFIDYSSTPDYTYTIDDLKIRFTYTGRPWWLSSLLCFNFEQDDPDDDPGLVMSGASGAYTNAFVRDLSPYNQVLDYAYGTSQDLVIARDSGRARLRYLSTGSTVPDYIKIENFRVQSGSLSFEFTYSHNKPSGASSSTDVAHIIQLGTLDFYHDQSNQMHFDGVGGGWSDGLGHSYVLNPPQAASKYTINVGPTGKTVHIDGVLALSSATGYTFATSNSDEFWLLRMVADSGSIGRDISLDDVIVTNNYILDPAKTRVIPG